MVTPNLGLRVDVDNVSVAGFRCARCALLCTASRNGPIILTGFSALNKLLGREVYTSQDQLGGPQVGTRYKVKPKHHSSRAQAVSCGMKIRHG